MKKTARRVTVFVLSLVMTVTMFPMNAAFATGTDAAAGDQTKASESQQATQTDQAAAKASQQAYEALPPAQQPNQAAPLRSRTEEMAKAENFARADADLEEEAHEAKVPEAFQMQSALDLYNDGIIKCSNENLKFAENKEGKGLMITGTPEDLNDAYLVIDKEFAFGENKVSHVRIDALAKSKTNITADFYYAGAKTPFLSIPLNKQKGSKTWNWPGDVAENVLEQEIQGTHEIWIYFKTDSTAKEVSVLLRGFEFMMDDNLPSVYVNIDESIQPIAAMNNDPEHNTECYGTMTVRTPAGFQGEYMKNPVEEATTETYEMEYIRGRGNSTWMADKKPYKIKLDKKTDFYNMGKSKHWLLIANRYDNSLLRNKITYWMGDQLDMPGTPQSEYVDVFMNGEYLGVYTLCEQIRVEKNRLNINDLEEDDPASEGIEATEEPTISGGYLLGISPYDEDWDAHPEQMFGTTRSNRFEIESPEFDKHTPEAEQAQYNYIKDYVQKTEDAIYGTNFCDADGNSWEKYLDKEAAIKYYWFQEVSMNGDAYISTSSYMYKERDTKNEDGTTTPGKLFFGPLWDFDYVAWGDLDYSDPPNIEEFTQSGSFWFGRLIADKAFADDLRAGYADMSKVLKDSLPQLDAYADKIRTADFYEREKWGTFGEGYYEEEEEEPQDVSFQDEVNVLKKWISARDEWITENLDELKVPVYTVTFKVDGKVVSTQTLQEGGYVEDIPDPGKKKGKVFAGWYANEDGFVYRADLSYPVYNDMTLTPKWVDEAKAVPIKKVYFLNSSVAIDTMFGYEVPEPMQFPVQIVPFNATQRDLQWTCSDQSILKINPKTGVCQPLERGTVTVTAKAANGKKATCTVTVRDLDDEADYEFSLKKRTITIDKGDYGKIALDGGGNPIAIDRVYFEYEGNGVITLADCGVFKALKPGKAKVTVQGDPYEEDSKVCTIIVKDKEKKGATVTRNGLKYGITKVWTKKAKAGAVKVKGLVKASKKTVNIPASIKINGHKYKVTAVAPSAFKGKKAITSVTFGANVRTIGSKAFYKCKKLKKVTFTGKTISRIGKSAFKGIAKKAVFTVPNAGKAIYKKKLTKAAGITKTMKIRAKKITYNKL